MVRIRTRPTLESLEARDVPAIFDVGFGEAYSSIGAVPWNNLGPGDTIRIHWRSEAQGGDYHEKINISGQGTADQPIQILGVGGPNGHTKKEKTEQLALQLTNPSGASLGGNIWARLFISDDDVQTLAGLPAAGLEMARRDTWW